MNELFNKTKNILNRGKETVVEVGETIINTTTNTINSIRNFNIEEIERRLEYIGYDISKVEISMTLPPRISFQIDYENSNIDMNREQEILNEESNDLIIIEKIIDGLKRAFNLQEEIKFNKKELKYIEVEVSLIPTIKLVYLDK